MNELLLQIPVIGTDLGTLAFLIIAAFAGGAFGAALGALPAFCFTGFMVIAGEAANALGVTVAESSQVQGEAVSLGTSGVTGFLGFGMFFGPHIAFAGGAAAAAYAAKKKGAMPEPGDGDYHPGKDIAYALGTRPDVLAVGGLFGIIGMIGTQIASTAAVPFDPIAIMVVVSAALHRLAFNYPLIGTGVRNALDMSPFENEEMRTTPDGGEGVATDGGVATTNRERLAVEPWLPHQYKWGHVAMIGLVAGLLGGFTAIRTGSAFLAFGISAASLTFLNLGVEKIPVTHHITLPASTAALAVYGGAPAVGSTSAVIAILVGGVFGVFTGLVGEVVQRIFYAHSDTHFDPPAAAIVVGTLVIAILWILGIFESAAWIPIGS